MSKLMPVLLAASLSFLLFVGMTLLIEPNQVAAAPVEKNLPISILFDVVDDDPATIIRNTLKEPEKLERPPVVTTTIDTKPSKDKVAKLVFDLPDLKGSSMDGMKLPTMMGGTSNGSSGPRVRINPAYPRNAAINNIEGFVTLIYDITPMGTTENIRVVEAKPRGVFEKNAKKALRKWKYSPTIVDNKAVGIFGESVTLQFRLEQDVL